MVKKKKKINKKFKKTKMTAYDKYVMEEKPTTKNFIKLLKTKQKFEVVKKIMKEKHKFEATIKGMDYKIYRDFSDGTFVLEMFINKMALPFDLPDYEPIAKFFDCEEKEGKFGLVFIKKYSNDFTVLRLSYIFNKNASDKTLKEFVHISLNDVRREAEKIRDKIIGIFELLLYMNDNIRKDVVANYFANQAKKGPVSGIKNFKG